jgi:hypothetical protein
LPLWVGAAVKEAPSKLPNEVACLLRRASNRLELRHPNSRSAERGGLSVAVHTRLLVLALRRVLALRLVLALRRVLPLRRVLALRLLRVWLVVLGRYW